MINPFAWQVKYRGRTVQIVGWDTIRNEEMLGNQVRLHVFLPDEIDIRADTEKPLPKIHVELDQMIEATHVS